MEDKDELEWNKQSILYLIAVIAVIAFLIGIMCGHFMIAPELNKAGQYVLPDKFKTGPGIIIYVDKIAYKIVLNQNHKPIFEEDLETRKLNSKSNH